MSHFFWIPMGRCVILWEPPHASRLRRKEIKGIVLKTFVISLLRASDRRASIQRNLDQYGLSFEIVEAVDGRALRHEHWAQYSAEAAIKTCKRELAPGEIGCALSHLSVYQRIVEENEEALILEDDALVGPDFIEVLANRDHFPPDWEIILFSHEFGQPLPWGKKRVTSIHQAVRFLNPVGLTSGYLLSVAGAKRLLRHAYPVRLPADGLTGRFRESGIRLYGIVPRCIRVAGFPTTIWPETDGALTPPAREPRGILARVKELWRR